MSIRNPFPSTAKTVARKPPRGPRKLKARPPQPLNAKILSERAKAATPTQGVPVARLPSRALAGRAMRERATAEKTAAEAAAKTAAVVVTDVKAAGDAT